MVSRAVRVLGWMLLFCLPAATQQPVPDAPSATRPPQTASGDVFSGTAPAAPVEPEPAAQPPAAAAPTRAAASSRTSEVAAAQPAENNNREEMFKLVVNVNQVYVPVTVKDQSGRLVDGLLRRDFRVLENGEEQTIGFFSSDPFPLSAAVVLDVGLSDLTLRKVNKTYSSLAGAFSQFDEIALYTYGNTVERRLEWSPVNERFTAELKRQDYKGRAGGVPVLSGPLASGPTVNGRPFDPGTPTVRTARRESKTLNDAILAAALDLSNRARSRRKIIFVIGDGKEEGSNAGYSEVLKVLLSNEITVYAVGVEGAATPVYGQLSTISLPGFGKSNILPKYASATGGDVLPEFSREAIEAAYSRITLTARNQYTLGYTTKATAASDYREIEVLVRRANVRVHARDGYYPLPPGHPSTTASPE
ncbi:MAG: VWA domain-containing protein [Acidobacteria bacterium]|nr:VWA domain-containing protein [Acidobacteriota bacterium]